jgi:flagellar FliL protein
MLTINLPNGVRAARVAGRIVFTFLTRAAQMNALKKCLAILLSLPLCIFLLTAHAEGGEGGGKEGKDNLHSKVEAITVNLQGTGNQYVQVELVLALANPGVDERVKKYMPVIRHKLIYLLTSKTAEQLGSSEGKRLLMDEAKSAINSALELPDKDGVTDVLFDSFIIQ